MSCSSGPVEVTTGSQYGDADPDLEHEVFKKPSEVQCEPKRKSFVAGVISKFPFLGKYGNYGAILGFRLHPLFEIRTSYKRERPGRNQFWAGLDVYFSQNEDSRWVNWALRIEIGQERFNDYQLNGSEDLLLSGNRIGLGLQAVQEGVLRRTPGYELNMGVFAGIKYFPPAEIGGISMDGEVGFVVGLEGIVRSGL